MNRTLVLGFALAISAGGTVRAQSNPLTSDVKKDYKTVRDYFFRSAERQSVIVFGTERG